MDNRTKIKLLRALHAAINDQLMSAIDADEDWESLENMPLYVIGIGNKVFRFPATLIYRVMFDKLFEGWDSLSDDLLAGIEQAASPADIAENASQVLNDPEFEKRIKELEEQANNDEQASSDK